MRGTGKVKSLAWFQNPGPLAPGAFVWGINQSSLSYIRGGRHIMGAMLDSLGNIAEANENDNAYYRQFAWSPLVLTNKTPVSRNAPPDRDSTGYSWYNCDVQFSLLGSSNSWWGGVGIIPTNAGDNYSVRMHDVTPTSEAGFAENVTSSSWAAGLSNFVLIDGNTQGSTATRWAGVVQGATTPFSGTYRIEFSEGMPLSSNGQTSVSVSSIQMQAVSDSSVPRVIISAKVRRWYRQMRTAMAMAKNSPYHLLRLVITVW